MNTLETRLRDVEFAEPPLGFDTDEVADLAARGIRRRRAGITGTLAAASVVVAAVAFAPDAPRVAPASAPVPPSLAEQSRIRVALADAVMRVLPGVHDLTLGRSSADSIGPDRMSVTAEFVDAGGRPGNFQLTVYGRRAPGDHVPVVGSCAEPESIDLRCDRIPQPGGAELLVFESASVNAGGGLTKLRGFNGVLHRADGSAVTIIDAADDAADSVQLSKEQLAKVITDPAFALPG